MSPGGGVGDCELVERFHGCECSFFLWRKVDHGLGFNLPYDQTIMNSISRQSSSSTHTDGVGMSVMSIGQRYHFPFALDGRISEAKELIRYVASTLPFVSPRESRHQGPWTLQVQRELQWLGCLNCRSAGCMMSSPAEVKKVSPVFEFSKRLYKRERSLL